MREEELGTIRHVHRKQLARLHALTVQVLAIAAGICIGLGPGVAAVARPDCFFLCWKTAYLGFELVPEGLARRSSWAAVSMQGRNKSARCTVLVEGALGGLLASDPADVFCNVIFGVNVGGCRTYTGNCSGNWCCDVGLDLCPRWY